MGNITVYIYAIRNKHTGVFLQFKNKAAWTSACAAKNAFGLHMPRLSNETKGYSQRRFDDQSEYELVDLVEAFYRLEGLEK